MVVVAILIAVQLFFQNAQKQLTESSKSKTSYDDELHIEKRDISYSEREGQTEIEVTGAAPIVPNIHRSYVKKKAPYIRKAKKNRRNKKNKKNSHVSKKEGGTVQKKKLKGTRNDSKKNHGKNSSTRKK